MNGDAVVSSGMVGFGSVQASGVSIAQSSGLILRVPAMASGIAFRSVEAPGVAQSLVSGIAFRSVEAPGVAQFQRFSITTPLTDPVSVRGDRVFIAEEDIETGKPYCVQYGKSTLVIRKTSDGKIHVHKLS